MNIKFPNMIFLKKLINKEIKIFCFLSIFPKVPNFSDFFFSAGYSGLNFLLKKKFSRTRSLLAKNLRNTSISKNLLPPPAIVVFSASKASCSSSMSNRCICTASWDGVSLFGCYKSYIYFKKHVKSRNW